MAGSGVPRQELSKLPQRPRTAPDIRPWRPGLRIWAMVVSRDSDGDYMLVPAVFLGKQIEDILARPGNVFVRIGREIAQVARERLFLHSGDGGREVARWNAFRRSMPPSTSETSPRHAVGNILQEADAE